jgi:hypothetical protein
MKKRRRDLHFFFVCVESFFTQWSENQRQPKQVSRLWSRLKDFPKLNFCTFTCHNAKGVPLCEKSLFYVIFLEVKQQIFLWTVPQDKKKFNCASEQKINFIPTWDREWSWFMQKEHWISGHEIPPTLWSHLNVSIAWWRLHVQHLDSLGE